MSASINQRSCPACGSEVEYWEAFDSWSCPECSIVLDAAGPVVKEPDDNIEFKESDDDAKGTRWQDELAIKDASEASLVRTLNLAEDVAEKLSLRPSVEVRAAEIIAEAWEDNFMHGRRVDTTVGAAIYAATRQCEEPVPPAQIADKLDLNKAEVKGTFVKLRSEQGLEVVPASPMDFTASIAETLELPQRVESRCPSVLQDGHPPGNPIAIACACVYLVANDLGEKISLREVGDVGSITKETVWRHVQYFREKDSISSIS